MIRRATKMVITSTQANSIIQSTCQECVELRLGSAVIVPWCEIRVLRLVGPYLPTDTVKDLRGEPPAIVEKYFHFGFHFNSSRLSATDSELPDVSPETGHSKIEKVTFLDTSARRLTATGFEAR